MSKPWGGVGAWAAEAERAEAEEREAASAAPTPEPQSFPSLKEATNSKQKKKKMTLSEFTLGYNSGGGYGAAKATDYDRLTPEEMMRLPTRPKERTAEEMQYGRLGGGFSSYGRVSQGPNRGMRDRDDTDGSWGGGRRSYGGFDEERRGPPSRASEYDQPSRADEVDNWAMSKKSVPTVDAGRQNRFGGLGAGGGMSRADEVDSWGAGKRPMQTTRSSTFGSGFRGSGPEPDRWTRGGGAGGGFPEERPRLILDPPRGDVQESAVTVNKPNPFGLARPREEVLAEKGLDWKNLDNEIDAKKTSRPASSHSSRPSSAQSSRSEGVQQRGMENVVKPRPKVNPFGDAKPREVLLEERGKDWRKIDLELEHRSIDRPETEVEKSLKEEIDHLKKELEKAVSLKAESDFKHEADGNPTSLVSLLNQKERDLEILIRDLDDKVRFGQRATERLGSAGRTSSFSDRPQSRPGSTEGSRNMDFGERPRSRGTSDSWSRPGDERRAFQGARERGFLGNRDSDRPRSRERW